MPPETPSKILRDAVHRMPIVSGLLRDGLPSPPATLAPVPIGHMPVAPMLRTSLFLSFLVLSTSASAADVYKYVDEKGKVQYTDKPLKLPAERLNVQSQRTDVVAMEERKPEEPKDAAAQNKAREAAAKQEAAKREADANFEANKIDACNRARSRYLGLMGNGRVYETLPNGERRYLESAELDTSRASAKESMDSLCN